MRYLITTIFLLAGLTVLSQERFTITVGTGVGQYKMGELKDFQEHKESSSGNLLETIDNFPAYLFYSGEVVCRIHKIFSAGVIYRLQSTGCKSAYSDYSGFWKMQQELKSDNLGVLIDFHLLTKSKFSIAAQGRVYYGWTTFKYTEHTQLYDYAQNVSYEITDKDESMMFNPDVSFSYDVVKHVSLNLTTGYCFDFKGDVTKLPSLVPMSYEYDWSGFRIGLSTSYKF